MERKQKKYLSDNEKTEVYVLHKYGNTPIRRLAMLYQVDQSTVWRIIKQKEQEEHAKA